MHLTTGQIGAPPSLSFGVGSIDVDKIDAEHWVISMRESKTFPPVVGADCRPYLLAYL